MSTSERYGTAVWEGLHAVSYLVEPYICAYVSVGEVAAAAKVSKPTAQKYLDMLAAGDDVASLKFGKQKVYRLIVRREE
jgi:response regulator of citrate/malate metabolism